MRNIPAMVLMAYTLLESRICMTRVFADSESEVAAFHSLEGFF